ncbi:MAG: hypothetical protein OHK0015_33020 [Chloroflexi bacterium OHK40]
MYASTPWAPPPHPPIPGDARGWGPACAGFPPALASRLRGNDITCRYTIDAGSARFPPARERHHLPPHDRRRQRGVPACAGVPPALASRFRGNDITCRYTIDAGSTGFPRGSPLRKRGAGRWWRPWEPA